MLSPHPLEKQLDSDRAEFLAWLADGGDGNWRIPCGAVVVVPDDTDGLGQDQTRDLRERLHDPCGEQIRRRDDAVDISRDHALGQVAPRLPAVGAVHSVERDHIHRQERSLGHRVEEASAPLGDRLKGGRAADEDDPPPPGLDQMCCGEMPTADIVDVHAAEQTGLIVIIQQHERRTAHAVRPGENAIGAWLGDGWFRGRIGFEGAGARLAELVHERGYRVSTGFLGTPVVTDALTRTGHLETAYRMVLNHDAPSWMATIDLGATTVWERWDSLLPDGTVNPGDMTSFNHYALGSVAHWIHGTIAGLSTTAPGGRELRIAPRPGPGVSSAGATLVTPYGEASVDWQLDHDRLTVSYTVPVGATAIVDLPGRAPARVSHGTYSDQLAV